MILLVQIFGLFFAGTDIHILFPNFQSQQSNIIITMQQSLFYINKSLISSNPSEKTLEVYSKVTLEENDLKIVNLQMKVTTHRLLLFSTSDHAFLIDGEKIHQIILAEHGMLWNKEYYIKIRTDFGKVKLFLNNYKEAHVTLNGMVKNQVWKKKQDPHTNSKMYTGIFNKIQKDKEKINENAHKVGSSFTSFQSLFANLREIKEVMNEMRQSTNDPQGENSDVKEILKDIGFVSTISKQESGRDYYKYLAQDLYNICQNTLFKKYGGIVSILDLFYFYNMKRQMQLISPEELLMACRQFQKFGYNAKLVSYPNNIKVIESTHFNEQADFQENYKNFFKDYATGYSVEQIARRKGQPLPIVEIKLKKALRRGILALDNRIQGEKYYKNLLMSV